jgi:hypothetical protein
VTPPANDDSPWFRQLWPWLLMLPPAAAVGGGIMMVWLATHTPAPLVVDDYARIEEITAARFARDEFAAINGLAASVSFDRTQPRVTRVSVRLTRSQPSAVVLPETLDARFRHVTEAQLDRQIQLTRYADVYSAQVALGAGAYVMELEPPDARWRLAARIRETDRLVEVRAGALP